MWRPKGWINKYAIPKGGIGITDPLEPRVLLQNAYESGADAILKAILNKLQEEYSPIDTWPCWKELTKQ